MTTNTRAGELAAALKNSLSLYMPNSSIYLDFCVDINRLAALAQAAPAQVPIDMVLHCPACGQQHIDAPEEEEYEDRSGQLRMKCDWMNPPHRSHLCHGCGNIWRPADVPTNGVEAVKTKGKADSPIAPAQAAAWTSLSPDGSVNFGKGWVFSPVRTDRAVAPLVLAAQASAAVVPSHWLVYLPSIQTQDVFDSQEDSGYIDWLTNYPDAEVTPLYSGPPAAPQGVAAPVAAEEELNRSADANKREAGATGRPRTDRHHAARIRRSSRRSRSGEPAGSDIQRVHRSSSEYLGNSAQLKRGYGVLFAGSATDAATWRGNSRLPRFIGADRRNLRRPDCREGRAAGGGGDDD
jgi:hypothetical protein